MLKKTRPVQQKINCESLQLIVMDRKIDVIIAHTDITCVRMIFPNSLLFFTLVVFTLINFGCTREIPADPMCRTSTLYSESAPAAAACLIKSNGKLLAIKRHDDEGWDIPNRKLHTSTSAQCTAHLGVWKTTGLNVEVGVLLFTGDNQTQYFACKLTDDYSSQLKTFPVPSWATRKTSDIALLDPFDTQQYQWIRDIDLIRLREAYTQLE